MSRIRVSTSGVVFLVENMHVPDGTGQNARERSVATRGDNTFTSIVGSGSVEKFPHLAILPL